MTSVDVVALFANADFWAAVLRIATPLIFGTLGALVCERAGDRKSTRLNSSH